MPLAYFPPQQSKDLAMQIASTSQQQATTHDSRILSMINKAHSQYSAGMYQEAQATCEGVYQTDAYHTNNLLLLGAIHFQLRNFSECIFYNQQCIRIDPHFAEVRVRG